MFGRIHQGSHLVLKFVFMEWNLITNSFYLINTWLFRLSISSYVKFGNFTFQGIWPCHLIRTYWHIIVPSSQRTNFCVVLHFFLFHWFPLRSSLLHLFFHLLWVKFVLFFKFLNVQSVFIYLRPPFYFKIGVQCCQLSPSTTLVASPELWCVMVSFSSSSVQTLPNFPFEIFLYSWVLEMCYLHIKYLGIFQKCFCSWVLIKYHCCQRTYFLINWKKL